MKYPNRVARIVALLATVLVALGAIELIDNDGDGRPDRVTLPIPKVTNVDGADRDTRPDERLPLDESAQQGLERALEGDTAKELQDPLNAGDRPEPLDGPLAAQETPGCRTAFVRNQSSRNGSPVRVIVWHQTVSRENGTSSQNALTAMANRPSAGVSWHYLIGRSRGLCTYSVPLTMKAWTQANANPFSVGIEVEAFGDEGVYVTGAGKQKLLDVTRFAARRFDIPLQPGLVVNCRVIRPGIVEHSDLGACGGGHIDVTLTTRLQTLALIREAAAGADTGRPDTRGERRACRQLARARTKVRRGGSWQDRVTNRRGVSGARHRFANARKQFLVKRKVRQRRYCNGR